MSSAQDEVVESPDIHFEPIVKLAPVEVKTMEENEDEIFKMRAKLFRFDTEAAPPEWKERGTGEVKFLQHKATQNVRLLMRRDKTHKICANHYLTPDMSLLPSANSDKAWVYTVSADFADEEAKVEQLAIRFKNVENATKFKAEFERCQKLFNVKLSDSAAEGESDKLAEDLEKLKVEEGTSGKESSEAEGDVKEETAAGSQDEKPSESTTAEGDKTATEETATEAPSV